MYIHTYIYSMILCRAHARTAGAAAILLSMSDAIYVRYGTWLGPSTVAPLH